MTKSLLDAIERYFDLIFDSNVARFDEVFAKRRDFRAASKVELRQPPVLAPQGELACKVPLARHEYP
jgi:hypothetical protein